MALLPPFDPDKRVWCNCFWTGRIKDAVCEINDVVRCPVCKEPVHGGESMASINDLLRQVKEVSRGKRERA